MLVVFVTLIDVLPKKFTKLCFNQYTKLQSYIFTICTIWHYVRFGHSFYDIIEGLICRSNANLGDCSAINIVKVHFTVTVVIAANAGSLTYYLIIN